MKKSVVALCLRPYLGSGQFLKWFVERVVGLWRFNEVTRYWEVTMKEARLNHWNTFHMWLSVLAELVRKNSIHIQFDLDAPSNYKYMVHIRRGTANHIWTASFHDRDCGCGCLESIKQSNVMGWTSAWGQKQVMEFAAEMVY